MTDYTLNPQHTLVVGMTGSGKTTFVIRYLLNAATPACTFIYDDLNRMWPRLRISPLYDETEMYAQLPTRWNCFVPSRMIASEQFSGDAKKVFSWWCQTVFEVCQRGPGKKFVVIPEVWKHCTPDSIPLGLAQMAQAGRELDIELVCDTQRPDRLNGSITGAATELVAFKLMESDALKELKKICANSGLPDCTAEVSALPLGRFIGWNRLSGARLEGKLF